MNNTMMLGLFALGGLVFLNWAKNPLLGWTHKTYVPNDRQMIEQPPAAQRRPDNPSMILAPPAAQRRPDNPPMFTGRNRLPEDADLDIGI